MSGPFCTCESQLKSNRKKFLSLQQKGQTSIVCCPVADNPVPTVVLHKPTPPRCQPPSVMCSCSPYKETLVYQPINYRPLGANNITAYQMTCKDQESSKCLAFLNNEDNDSTWMSLKKRIPMAKRRILQLPAKTMLHFNNYYVRELHPDSAASWKIVKRPGEQSLRQIP